VLRQLVGVGLFPDSPARATGTQNHAEQRGYDTEAHSMKRLDPSHSLSEKKSMLPRPAPREHRRDLRETFTLHKKFARY
jgi:hypothetical protein